MHKYFRTIWPVCMVAALGLFLAACGAGTAEETGVQSYLYGVLTVKAEIDSTGDYGGFEVLVASSPDGDVDTLGLALTDSTGAFSLDVRAPDRGVYPLIVSRGGTMLAISELVVSPGDSAQVQAKFPLNNRPILIRSTENAAWMGYRNAKTLHNRELVELLGAEDYDEAAITRAVGQTSAILWSLRSTFPNTIGAMVATAESIVMLDGWNDTLLVSRARQIDPQNPSLSSVARAARRAEARVVGHASSLQLVRDFQAQVTDENTWAALQSELVLAHMDSLEEAEALAAVHELAARAPNQTWVSWAERALYDLENLRPGMTAPGFIATTNEGASVGLDSLRGRLVLLEFYTPGNQTFQRELPLRNALYSALAPRMDVLAISLEPDTLLNEAFLDGREIPGFHIFATGGMEGAMARLYNVNALPTRFLINRQGQIVGKYVSGAIRSLEGDLVDLIRAENAG